MVWPGQWVADRLGVRLTGDARLPELLGLALRRNPRRAHLLVSTVLGKHMPQRPGVVRGAGLELGRRVRDLLGSAEGAVVLGYAETATGLGHCVADGLGPVSCLHSTRRAVPGMTPAGGFEEEHSHATSHLLLPSDAGLLTTPGPLVLVDDELSTGRTVRNTIAALHTRAPRRRYVVASLVDVRSSADRAGLAAFAAELGIRIDVVALATGEVALPPDVLERGSALVAELEGPGYPPTGPAPKAFEDGAASGGAQAEPPAPVRAAAGEIPRVDLGWPAGLPDGGRHGFTPAHRERLEAALPAMAERLAARIAPGKGGPPARILVLGTEELMYAPLRLAEELQNRLPHTEIRFSTTTRSPVVAMDHPGYAIRSRLTFPAHDGSGEGDRYAYNIADGRFDVIVSVIDDTADTPRLHAPGGLLHQLSAHTERALLAVIPSHRPGARERREPLRGPAFSSYAPEDVGWLLQDLSAVTLEAPTEEREEAIQRGGAHYAESLPQEYQPSERYQELYRTALDASAARVARAVGTVTNLVLAERSPRPVLVSLARAGTPVGILMRRWARYAHGLDLPHYALSIVRGRGIDTAALRWLADHHDPADVVFVDGWTGKGAITRELDQALRGTPFDPRPAVLADPGHCVDTFGTRDDFLIPSACLNSTVSGLISRTVLRADLVGPEDFHGAKFYRELAAADVSRSFLDTVGARFPDVHEEATLAAKELADTDRTPTWSGWAAMERISAEYGIGDTNLVKPGVGETTRVLLRRVPWKILARRGAGAELAHIRLLAEQRGVPVAEVDELPYNCVGLIHPRYTRGATGANGQAVQAR